MVIDDPENTSGRVTIQARGDYQSVVVNWFDEVNQIEVPEVAGSGEPQYKIRRNKPNQDEARRAAKAKLDDFLRGQASISFTRPLTASMAPETKVTFVKHNSAANRSWLIESIEHSIDGSGVSSTRGRGITPQE
ncbi:contractile injection system protein, VgrG/Pvc8 family [bacterium]|nr:contractile injection system protein, VgrG/Pvc8 family [bacterium]